MKTFKSNRLAPVLLAAGLALSASAFASVPYVDHEVQVKQPDGSNLTIVLNGTTHYADQRTTDGYPVIYDTKHKGYTYARLSKDGQQFVSSGLLVVAGNRHLLGRFDRQIDIPKARKLQLGQLRAEQLGSDRLTGRDPVLASAVAQPQALTGNVRGLTILIQFPDQAGTIAKAQVKDYANKIGYTDFGNAQSIRDYFKSVSGGKLDYTNTVTEYFTASRNKSYYTDTNVSYGTRAQELIREALNWLETTRGFDFSSLTTDSSGKIMGLNVFYAGDTDGGWSQGLWPHMGGLRSQFCADGVCASQYQITNMGDALSIGTFIHESGHLIGNWPDLYDYDGSSNGSAGEFCVMGYGSLGAGRQQKPVPPNGYFRHLAGWETVTELNPALNGNAPVGQVTHEANSNTLYRWSNPGKSGEAFYVETRTQSGQSELLPDAGLVIWHVDRDGNNSDEWHPYVQMEHADGARQPENKVNRGDEHDMYDATSQAAFGYSTPVAGNNKATNSRWWNGADSGFELQDISAPGANMTFTVGTSVPDDSPTALVNGQSTSVSDAAIGEYRYFVLDVPSEASSVAFTLTGSNGDADLYVKQGAKASESDNDCKSTSSNSNESCSVGGGAASWHAAVHAYSGFSGLQIKGEYATDSGSGGEVYTGNLSGANDKDIQPNGSYFQYGGGTIEGQLSGPANADFDMKLYQWLNGSWQQVAASTSSTSSESITHNAQSGYYRFEIYSYSGSGDYTFTLKR